MPELIDVGIYIADPKDPFFKDLVKKDLLNSRQETRISLDSSLQEALLVQTVLGHAQNGHKVFYGADAKFPFATITDIIEAADLDVGKVKSQRQGLIDDVFEWVELAKQDKTDRLVVNNRPLLGVEFLRGYQIEPEFTLKGMVLAGMMDNYEWRKRTLQHYDHKTIDGKELVIGGGGTYLIDLDLAFNEELFLLERLRTKETDQGTIDRLREKGVITTEDNPNAEVSYVRRKAGLGTSDDTAFIMMGQMYKGKGWVQSLSAFYGGFIVDGIDTYDKCVARPVEKGYDEKLGEEIRETFPDLVTDEEIKKLIYYSAKGNGDKLVSSSHKRLIQIVTNADPKIPTILHHLKFLDIGVYAPFRIGFEGMPSARFYESVKQRISHYQKFQ